MLLTNKVPLSKCLRNLRMAPILELPLFGIVLLQNKQWSVFRHQQNVASLLLKYAQFQWVKRYACRWHTNEIFP